MRRRSCAIIPDDVLEKLKRNAPTAEERDKARRSLAISQVGKARRLDPVEPGQGEHRVVHNSNHTSEKGEIVREEDGPSTGDEALDSLYNDTGIWYQTTYDKYQRRSYDGLGSPLFIVGHYEKDFDNALYDGWGTWYGDGYFFQPFYLARTVVYHEWTHALIEKTVNLQYLKQAGALNEGVADAKAASHEQWLYQTTADVADWLIGRELMGGRIKGGRALRSMINPGTAYNDPLIGEDPQRAHMRDYYSGPQDNYGVHINSGIFNRAFALACIRAGGFSIDTIFPIVMEVLIERMVGSQATFQEFANAMYTAAVRRGKRMITDAITYGWSEVGIEVGESAPAPEPPAPSPCELSDLEVLTLARMPGLAHIAPVMASIATMTDAEVLASIRNPVVVEAARAVAAMPQARKFMMAARALRRVK